VLAALGEGVCAEVTLSCLAGTTGFAGGEHLEGVEGKTGLLCFVTGDFAGVVFTTVVFGITLG
jgi:hypothetical protein